MDPDQHQATGLLTRLSPLTLSQRFGICSFLAVLLLGIVLAVILGRAVQTIALTDARQSAYDDLHGRLLRHIEPSDLAAGHLTGERDRAFGRFVSESILSGRTIRVKVWNAHGTVVYSNDPRIVGHTFAIEGELQDALRGELASEVSDLTKSENRDDRRYGKLLEVYIPIRFPHDRTIRGAFEIYQAYGPVARQISSLQHTLYGLLAGGLLILYLLLFGIVQRGSQTIAEQQRRLRKQALHDDLTDLPNRTLLHDRVQHATLVATRRSHSLALLLMDVDHFKEINDTFGHHYGDLLLQQFGARLQSILRESDTIARLGGDEFGILLPETDDEGAVTVVEKILDALGHPFDVQGHTLTVGASIGIAFFPAHGTDATTLLQRADVAMYHAKRAGAGHAVYAVEHDDYSPDRLALINELREAIMVNQLVLYFQPKVCLKTDCVDGVEALVRWQHPERGLIPPDQFIPLAEHTGLIRPLTTWVLQQALAQCAEWRAAGLDLPVAVNLSARSVHDPSLIPTIRQALTRWNLPAHRLEIELTESALMADPDRGAEMLRQLHAMGVHIAIDDFGTGYSSLTHLQRLPVDELKIDKSFVQNMASNEGDVFIVRSVADLGHSLGLTIVAEGVEDDRSLRLLSVMGCDLVQGYHVSRPLPARDLRSWMQRARSSLAT